MITTHDGPNRLFTDPLEDEDCAICKDSFTFIPPDSATAPTAEEKDKNKEDVQPQEALTLPCKHSFHEECIVPWVRVKGTCPVCRFELIGQAGGRNAGRNEGSSAGGGNPGGPQRRDSGGSGGGSDRLGRGGEEDRRGSPMPPGAYELD